MFSILTTIVIVGMYQIFAVGRFNYPEFRLKEGQISETEVLAPFDFPVLKPENELAEEKERKLAKLRKPYTISEEIMFDALSAWDEIYAILSTNDSPENAQYISLELKKSGWTVSPEVLGFASRSTVREKLYNKVRNQISTLYKQGIIDASLADSVLIVQNDKLIVENTSKFNTTTSAGDKLKTVTPELNDFLAQIAPQLIKANIVVDEEKLNELSQRSLGSVSPSEGVILQNEVIIRKNTRVTPADIQRLESLQDAYRNRNVRKSPLQELLTILGLFVFVFIVISLANHYFGVQNKEERLLVADFLPLNLGFILLTLFACLNNYVFGYSNLLIPFAMVGLSAAILVSFEYGLLYSICSLLVVSPFINWETFSPIVLILSTLITLLLMRRQNAFHEYATIGFYLVISTILTVSSIAIYKNDPLLSTLRSIGIGLASAALSIGGIILIVPYYERKWNRATKQTMLELLDFNHPLLKRLATEAVGTYHHSLIVGNLAERAAEAIGANPLLARVGSYYHDIGKIINTEIFTENNEDSAKIHNIMVPEESANLIRNHVSEGIVLAKKYHIPQPVIDIIMQHHGSSIIRFFYDKAQKSHNDADKLDYQYPGPRPQTKEAVLVMISDIVESTTKSKNIENEEDITKIVDDTINRLIREGQFDEAPITIRDLHRVKATMIPVLESIYRKRQDYPAQKDE